MQYRASSHCNMTTFRRAEPPTKSGEAPMSLAKRHALVTGSTSGIGLAIARAVAKEGADVMINGFGDAKAIEAERAGIEKEFGVRAFYNGADMSKGPEIEAMIADAQSKMGSLDILVNNAGIQHVAPIEEFPPETWNAIININLNASFHTIRTAIPYMKKQGWGRIVQIASVHALVASPFKSAYVTAKHGLAGLTKAVALEVAQNKITCNAICPGYVWTPLVAGQIAELASARGMSESELKSEVITGTYPTRELTTAEQIGDLVVFLCTPAANNI